VVGRHRGGYQNREGITTMSTHRRIGLAVATATLGVLGTLGLTACGQLGGGQAASTVADILSPEAQALVALGINPADLAPGASAEAVAATASASPGTDKATKRELLRQRRAVRGILRNTLHGEAVVQTANGTKTVQVQRGTVTAINDTSVTVKSSDGFTLTWTFGKPIKVIEHRTTVQPKDVAVGATVGVAGSKDGDSSVASLLVIPKAN
jgi:hypothetical protein